ncbi:MAG: ATP-binding protein [Euryarchaeota archaeon]|nr:ATP-binding protein [Euryarchaeota archaeon]MBU4071854.1 ATP-binding protein [Candidatus Thermoplasmatota archaeon]MBU4144733.1 ATP-binding protein [Candidatus Thermoplasmatota archaeon]
MGSTNFINREEELKFLKDIISKPEFQFIPVWGRRRVGKTRLLTVALSGKGVYFLATESSATDIARHFRDEVAAQISDDTFKSIEPDWNKLFSYLAKLGIPIIIDEFPYLITSDSSIPSVFQKIIDTSLQGTETKLFLCGSSVRMMESHVLDYKAPLYGRRTGQLKVDPMKFEALRYFFPDYSFEDLVRAYGACGGIPMYLLELNPKQSFWQNVESAFFNPHNILYAEADFLLKEEFTSAATYRSILGHIAAGKTQLNDIRLAMNAGKSDISPYLSQLSSVGFVRRELPVTEDPVRSRRGSYRIADNYLDFHFRYVVPGKGMIESGNPAGVTARVKKDFDAYLGRITEDIVKEAFMKWSAAQNITWDRTGSWWYGEEEIDLMALSSERNEMLCGEVKWAKKPLPAKDVRALMDKSELVRWGTPGRKTSFLIFSRGGFSKGALSLMEENGIIGWTPEELGRIFWDPQNHVSSCFL